ncbi:alkaline phosphatase family protein [Thalassotalea sp. M1531]|uniref:Alkaline phosphatase family protein n=1 Tax=Thalassotalea algicola TaxID=2716224 RepID=A0A7Y0Q7W7_9GAMM|nr:ectonucleotide pyrophosphatase/phosphodiesterase [Thalassotalea algicola]NMP32342.1 alkaline phosphatase family protein [Thalassotalea algicola]
MHLRKLVLSLLFLCNVCFGQQTLVLLSIDGFSHDYIEKYKPKHLTQLAKAGVQSEGLIPVYPTKTFPNHLSIVTGKYPANHGIFHNSFYHRELDDVYAMGKGKHQPKWLTAKPIWVYAEKQGVKAASFFWPESEALIDNTRPSKYYSYDGNISNIQRVEEIENWLIGKDGFSPQFITSYFSIVDDAGHDFGPDSNQVAKAIREVDELIGRLAHFIKTVDKPINLVIVSDHGMVNVDKIHEINTAKLTRTFSSDIKVVKGGSQLFLYSNNKEAIKDATNQLDNHLTKFSDNDKPFKIVTEVNAPTSWHINWLKPFTPDIIVDAKPPHTFSYSNSHYSALGNHGFAPEYSSSLNGIFIAQGPAFKHNLVIEPFENIHLFPVFSKVLNLEFSQEQQKSFDGDFSRLNKIFKLENDEN